MELKQDHKYLDLYVEGQATIEQEAILMDYITKPVIEGKITQLQTDVEAMNEESTEK